MFGYICPCGIEGFAWLDKQEIFVLSDSACIYECAGQRKSCRLCPLDTALLVSEAPPIRRKPLSVTLALLRPYIICHTRGSNSQPHYDNSHYQLLHSLSYATPLV